jgi:hypothetical protein
MDLWWAWGVVALAAIGVLVGVFRLTRGIRHPNVRWGLRALVAVWLLVPWSIQVVPGHLAPAFVVAIFEGLFREDGSARSPLVVLGLASAAVVLVFVLSALLQRLRHGRDASAPNASE